MNLDLERADAVREVGRQGRQLLAIDLDAVHFHLRDDGRERAIDHLVDARRALGDEPRLEAPPQPQRHIGILRRVTRRRFEIDLVEAALRLADADHVLERDAAVREMRRGKLVHAVAVEAGVEIEAHQDRVVMRRDAYPQPSEHDHVVFEIMPDL